MTHKKPPYLEPLIPARDSQGRERRAKAFTNCSIEVSKYPLDVFMLAGDGRKGVLLCRNRKALLAALASYADPDGTSCYPSRGAMEKQTCFSYGSVAAYLNDLEELGFILKGGYAWEGGTRVRRLVIPGVEAWLESSSDDAEVKAA